MKEIEAGNKIIAEFMGRVRNIEPNKKTSRYVDSLNYHTSWDWLMPIVEKIEKVWWTDFDSDVTEEEIIKQVNKVIKLPLKTNIENVWFAVIGFINWFNQNKK